MSSRSSWICRTKRAAMLAGRNNVMSSPPAIVRCAAVRAEELHESPGSRVALDRQDSVDRAESNQAWMRATGMLHECPGGGVGLDVAEGMQV